MTRENNQETYNKSKIPSTGKNAVTRKTLNLRKRMGPLTESVGGGSKFLLNWVGGFRGRHLYKTRKETLTPQELPYQEA